ncbi:MAG: DUF5678 domain-containing protein [bacterium]
MNKMPKKFWEDRDWAFKNYSSLMNKYKNEWVAIVDKKVVASGALGRVEEKAKKKTGRRHIPVLFIEGGGNVYKN